MGTRPKQFPTPAIQEGKQMEDREKPVAHTPVVVNIFERLCVVDCKDTEEAFSCPHVLVTHSTVLLLPSCVQDIQETRLSIDYHLLPV